ncbi:SemiSWEET transporter [Actinoplanes teichomyceticus]|uniref:Uncharacterized protein with PQ loop repeat n=1 Tax=Actinoplanes teichomyceticus TaxID=1867 RepID=A0A561WBB1_ACTTI|nr:SemiSWEET transporter [Actinoplanes teichomyceticus]TWG21156.1 uncharacterized protein with PQ loop repeat [Actinoplanes teichomyceticus]GIF14978.1 hypothetical protein Ate01nite_50100 [Actinoplanes teichomyceticus]
MLITVLGWFAAALSMALLWPQVWTSCVRRRTAGLSLTATWLGVALPVGWVTYGLLIGDRVQVVTNTVAAVAGVAVLTALLVTQPALSRRRAGAGAGAALVLLLATAAAAGAAQLPGIGGRAAGSVLGAVLTVAVVVANIPQPLALLRDRGQDLSGVSPARWAFAAAANLCWSGYGHGVAQPAVLICGLTGLASSLVVCWVLATAARPARTSAATRPAIIAESTEAESADALVLAAA